jgi:Rieske Fe-S protein
MSERTSRRAFIAASAASIVWVFTGRQASASNPSISIGSPCKVAGRERTVNGVTFVCRKEKKKMVWQRKKFPTVSQVTTERVLESASLAIGETKIVNVLVANGGTTGVVLTRTESGVTALRVNCSHQGFPVNRINNVLECDLHGSQFDPVTGAVLTGPAVRPLLRYEASESNGGIYVTIRPN